MSIDTNSRIRHATDLGLETRFGRWYASALTVLAVEVERHDHVRPYAGAARITWAEEGLSLAAALARRRSVGGRE